MLCLSASAVKAIIRFKIKTLSIEVFVVPLMKIRFTLYNTHVQ